ncbi:MAG: UbiX family flavin prenyltransferase [Thermoplasmata archaeon]|nr:UbiX family flavin prenyltransferase [Thermoplasmata archaeon]
MVIGVTGASGAPIARRVLEGLHSAGEEVVLIVSSGGAAVLKEECGVGVDALEKLASRTYSDRDLASPIASGSRPTRAMAIVPCSANSAAKVALGLSDTLITRAAQVTLKERRRLVVVPRETPVPTTLLRHLTTLSELGVVVLFASPAFYTHPKSVEEMVDFLAGRVLDHLGVPHRLYKGWKEGEA